eukprot:Gregarina_sp_Poly_1__6575@NODE_3526_length_1035_cov_144_799587_g2236_i0_p1_GENE_NODE_3526_length_1035_cov_144_799587_g2236_i0NODE_3526_length_1035_cov_144_799587_g2236_i0_p1_ORF_typecomplete_len230_score20_81DUF2150/PF09920_9/0_067_NODE_3526_length_1035_cov_144_799587_g2236_i0302991
MCSWPPELLFSHIWSAKPKEVTWPHVKVAERLLGFSCPKYGADKVSVENWRYFIQCTQLEAPERECNFNVSYERFIQALNTTGDTDVRNMRMGSRISLNRIRRESIKPRPDKTSIMLVSMDDFNIAIQQLLAVCIQEKLVDESSTKTYIAYLAHVPAWKEDCRAASVSISCRAIEFRFAAGEQPEISSSLPELFTISSSGVLNEKECRRFIKFQQSLSPLDIVMGDLPR